MKQDTEEEGTQIAFFSHDTTPFVLDQQAEVRQWLLTITGDRAVTSLEYVYCSDDFLLEINRTHLNHDYLTDVITFPLQYDPMEATVYISIDRVRENADLYASTFMDELHRVMVHGILHLLGYDDKTPESKSKMREMEDASLARRHFI